MTSRCCWFIRPASAMRTNRYGCGSGGMMSRLPEAAFHRLPGSARSEIESSSTNRLACSVDPVFGQYDVATLVMDLVEGLTEE